MSFGLSVFIRRDNEIFQTYFISGRGVEQPSNTFGFLDITPGVDRKLGRTLPKDGPKSQPIAGSGSTINTEYRDPGAATATSKQGSSSKG